MSGPNGHSASDPDAIVVGAGAIGLAVAWRAAQRDLSVLVLERAQPGSGASTVAAGMLSPVLEADFGEEPLVALNLSAAAGYEEVAEELLETTGIDPGYRRTGALHVALDRDGAEELRRLVGLQRSLGLEVDWLLPSAARELEPGISPRCAGAVHAPGEAQVDPRALVPALRAAAERAGARIEAGVEVASALQSGGRVTGVVTADGRRISAGFVVAACGAWSGEGGWIPRQARPPIRPVRGEVLELRASVPPCERMLRTPCGAASRMAHAYLVPRADGRLVVGSTVEERGFDTAVGAGGLLDLLREAYALLPEVAEMEFVAARAGLRPGSPDNAPLIGRTSIEGLVLATGHYRNGILLAPTTGEAVAALLAGEPVPEPVAPFAPQRFGTEAVA